MTVTENGTQDPRGASSAENLNLDVAERIAQREKCPNQLALVARVRELESRIRELEDDRDSWAEQASQRTQDAVNALESASQRADDPVAWSYECRQPCTDPVRWAEFISRSKPKEGNPNIRNVRALYDNSQAIQPGGEMAENAARYLYLRDYCDLSVRDVFGSWCPNLNDGLDVAIDAARAATAAGNGEGVK